MHEVTVETEAFVLRLVFAEIRYEFVGHEPVPDLLRKNYPINLAADGTSGSEKDG